MPLCEPFIILGGELANSSASSADYMNGRHIWETLREAGLNTVLVPVYWELIEPEEGRFDFSSVDYLIGSARKNGLHLVLYVTIPTGLQEFDRDAGGEAIEYRLL